MNFNPELDQIMYGNFYEQYEVPEYVVALLQKILDEINRIYWNHNREVWDKSELLD